jgi:glycogen(starch) synthase
VFLKSGVRAPAVALVASSFAPYVGGVEEHVRHVAAELRDQGVRVVVWTVDRGEGLGVQQIDGTTVRYLPCPLPSATLRGVTGFVAKAPSALRQWLLAWRRDRPEILHVQCFGPNGLYALAMHRVLRLSLVISSHGETFADDHAIFEQSSLIRVGFREALRRAAAVTGCSVLVVNDLADRFGFVGTVIVPNGVTPVAEAPVSSNPPLSRRRSGDIVALGRLEHVKGFDLLLRAFAEAALPDDIHLVIGGEGSQLQALEQLTTELGLEPSVRFVGRVPPDEVDHFLRSASVAVVPSRSEAFGMVVLEAWRAGTPVIASSRGGPAHLVADGIDGVLVDPEMPRELTAALVRLTGDADLRQRLAHRGTLRVRDFTWATVVGAYAEIYRRTLPSGDWQD